jgi:hypothetical protein
MLQIIVIIQIIVKYSVQLNIKDKRWEENGPPGC